MGYLLDFLIVNFYVVVFLVFVTFDQFAARHSFFFRLAVDHLLNARVVGLVKQVEADGFAPYGAE